jgi:hydroxyethylthiazole kinase-like uncharacterized protein yjeF
VSAAPPARARSLGAAALRAWPLPEQADGGDKEARGRILVVGGERELAGAVRLAGEAALRAGAGKLQIAVAASVAPALAVAVPEARVLALAETPRGGIAGSGPALAATAARADALVLGPGLERGPAVRALARRLLPRLQGPVVLDAGALDLTLLRAWHRLEARPAAVLTPHHGEMAALMGCMADEVAAHAPELARAFARQWGVVVVLKDACTWIAEPGGGLWSHRDGPEGLGTSGSGDVLAGLLGGLCARGASPAQAACWAVWLHARAAARLQARGAPGLLAREIAAAVPALLRTPGRR